MKDSDYEQWKRDIQKWRIENGEHISFKDNSEWLKNLDKWAEEGESKDES